MDYSINRIFVPLSTLVTTGDTSTLGTQRMGFYNPKTFQALAAYNVDELLVAFGSGVDKWGSFKTSAIKKTNVIDFTKSVANTTAKQQITYIGWDEVEDSKSPTFKCDEEYIMTFLIREYYSRGIYQPLIRESIRIKTACCDDCSSNCDSLDCKVYMQEAVDKINANPLLSKYLTAELVSKCTGSAATKVFALTLPDPGTSTGAVGTFTYTTSAAGLTNGTYTNLAATGGSGAGATFDVVVAGNVVTSVTLNTAGSNYVAGNTLTIAGTLITSGTSPADNITVTVVSGAEGALLAEVQDMFESFVNDKYTDIVFSADADDSSGDTNSTGNVRIELTPSAGVELTDLPDYNGIKWEEVTLSAGTEACTCGIKVTGKALDEFGTPCIPDAVPYVANLVRFHAHVHEGPYNTQDFDLESDCAPWGITTTQEVAYSIGDGEAMAERERHYFRYNLPSNVVEAGYYWNPVYNNDTKLYADATKEYTVYRVDYYINEAKGFEKKFPATEAIEIWVDSTNSSLLTSVETALETFTGITV